MATTERTYREWIESLAQRGPSLTVETDGVRQDILDHLNELEDDGPMCICEWDTEIVGFEITSMDEQGYRVKVEAEVF